MEVIVYHNPNCSKSRETLDLIAQQGIAAKIIRYLETPMDEVQLKAVLKKLNMNARQLLREGDASKELNLEDPSLNEDKLINVMVQHPELIQRPIVVVGKHAVIGRPAKNILTILPK